jgi:hypothetical protein
MLSEFVVDVQERYKRDGFAWGERDCCVLWAEWVEKMTGVDHMADLRGKYSTRAEALKLAGGDLRSALAARLGPAVPMAQANRGDLALMGDAVGILFTSGRLYALFLGEGGFTLHRAEDCDCAFHVG